VFRKRARARINKMCALSALISTSTYFPAFQCVCILIAWEKSIMKEKERTEGRKRKRKCRNFFFTFISFLPPEKKIVIFKLSSKFSWINELLHYKLL
jgi:hypothetical protein